MRRCAWLVSGLLAAAPAVLANGGGYFRGGVETSGGIAGFEPEQTGRVRIVDELLRIELGASSARVSVRYIMRNVADSDARVRFGFPVEEAHHDLAWNPLDEVPAVDASRPAYCRDYRIEAGGRPLDVKFKGEPTGEGRFRGLDGWLVSRADFDRGEEQVITIAFTSDYPVSQAWVSDDGHEAAKVFRYRLSTGACWAGTIGRGRIEVTAAGIDPAEVRVLKPAGRFRRDGARWIWEFGDLEPTQADDIEIEAVPAVESHSRPRDGDYSGESGWVNYENRAGRWEQAHRNYRVRASSTLAPQGAHRYDAANLNDDDPDNAWSEGAEGPGVGEWLEIEPDVAQPLRAIEVLPGYVASEALFLANARPKRIGVELNGEFRFEGGVPDRPENCRIPVVGYGKPVKKIRLEFLEVYPGGRHQDLCLSGVDLRVALAKKPHVTPQR